MLVVVLTIVLVILIAKRKNPQRLIATFAFSNILTKKIDNCGGSREWLFTKVVLGEEDKKVTKKVFLALCLVFSTLFISVLMMFFQLLLLDISYSCDHDDKTKDCFEYEAWNTKRYSNEPINCSSAAVQNGSVDVVCYKFVFNVGLAIGASYGTFKFAMVLVNLAAAAMLMTKQAEKIKKIRIAVSILALGVIGAFTAVRSTRLRVFLVSDLLTFIVQTIALAAIGCTFVIFVPWKELIELKNAQSGAQATGVDNPPIAMDAV